MKRYALPNNAGTKSLFEFYLFEGDNKMEEKTPHKTSVPHRHDFYEIWFFKAGIGKHYIENQSYPINPHSIHFLAPENIHLLERAKDSIAYLIAFSAELFDVVFNQHTILHKFPRYEQRMATTIIDLEPKGFESICKLIDILEVYKDAPNYFIKASIIHTILTIILPLVKDVSLNDKAATFLYKFYKLLNLHFTKHYQTNEYAALLDVSSVILNRRIKKMTGLNVSTHIKDRMILEAKRLLMNSDYSIKEIAYQLGFKEASYFSQYFSKHTKQSPSSFRKKGFNNYIF